jgi:hypothetical protein
MSTAESISSLTAGNEPSGDQVPMPDPKAGADQARAVEILNLWLRWNAVYENVTAAMFERRLSQQELQESMDLADQLRQKAIQATQELLGPYKAPK